MRIGLRGRECVVVRWYLRGGVLLGGWRLWALPIWLPVRAVAPSEGHVEVGRSYGGVDEGFGMDLPINLCKMRS